MSGPRVQRWLDNYSINGMLRSVNWTGDALNETIIAEIAALPRDMRAKFEHISNMIGAFGLERMREP